MTVMKQPATNTLELTEKIDKALADLKKTLPADITDQYTNISGRQILSMLQ